MLTYVFLHLPDDPGLLGVAAAQHQHQVAGVTVDPDQAEEHLLQPQALSGDGEPVLLHRRQEHLVLVSQHSHATLLIILSLPLKNASIVACYVDKCLFVFNFGGNRTRLKTAA